LAIAALGLWLLGCIVSLVRPSGTPWIGMTLSGIACVLCIVAAFLPGGTVALQPPFGLAGVEIGAFVDSLSRWFLGIIGVVGLAVTVYTPDYLKHLRGHAQPGWVWSGMALLFASMSGVVVARNAIVFFAAWEMMALSSFLLVGTEHERQTVRNAAFIYLGATRIGSAFLMGGFFWAHALTGSWNFQDWNLHGPSGVGPAILIGIGFLTKAGSWPFHLWLPIAHPAAPSPVSAVMSGVMIKTAIYGILRVFVIGGIHVPWMGWVLVGLGAISAAWGALISLLQGDLKRVLAYSSVENIGLILIAAGIASIARAASLSVVADLAFAAALYHSLTHGVFKSLLFLGTGTVDSVIHTRDMDRMGGLVHKMPWTAGAFFVGSAAMCALPLFSGFASEWLLYRALVEMATVGLTDDLRLAGLLLLGWVGFVGAVALASSARAFGISFLGEARGGQARKAVEGTNAMVGATVFLATLCVIFGFVGPQMWRGMHSLGLVRMAEMPALPMIPMAMALAGIGFSLYGAMTILAKRRPTRDYGTWDCGFGLPAKQSQQTAGSFAQPIVRLFGALYRYEMNITFEGKGRRHFPTDIKVNAQHEIYLESKVYEPALRGVLQLSERLVMRMQAGNIHQYLLLMLITLVVLLRLGGVL
jgi:hydrogenase-4 component B